MIKQKNINNRYVTLQHQLHFVSLRHIEAHKTTYIFFPQVLRNEDPAFGHVRGRPLENCWIWKSGGESRGGHQQWTPVKHLQGYSPTISEFVLFILTYFPNCPLGNFCNTTCWCPPQWRKFHLGRLCSTWKNIAAYLTTTRCSWSNVSTFHRVHGRKYCSREFPVFVCDALYTVLY